MEVKGVKCANIVSVYTMDWHSKQLMQQKAFLNITSCKWRT